MDPYSNFQTAGEVEQHADRFVQEFLGCLAPARHPAVSLVFGETVGDRRAIRATVKNGRMELHVGSHDLSGIPASALQGWLELAIVTCREQQRPENYFNFQNRILPLMRVAGGALLYIRELAELLSRSLQRRNVTKILCEMGRGEPQVSYYFYTIHSSSEEKEMYGKFLAHNWSRASYLCGKLIEYMGLNYLADREVGFSMALLSDWPQQHEYLPADQALLDDLVALADRCANRPFSARMVEMFTVLRDRLLLGSGDGEFLG